MSTNSPTTGTMSSTASTKTSAKKVAKKTDVPSAAVPTPVAVSVSVPVVTEKDKTKRVVKKAADVVVAATEVVAPVVATKATKTSTLATTALPTPVDAAAPVAAVAAPVSTLEEDFRRVSGLLSTFKETLSELFGEVKRLEKRVNRDLKDARKRRRRNRVVEGPDGEVKAARPSIFEIPTTLTEELNTFLGNPKGTQMSRSAVTKAITKYIKDNDLKNKHDINPDAKLRTLLSVDESIQLSYFNLQRYLNRHYVKAVPAAVVPVATA
jgi:hypothetical protein